MGVNLILVARHGVQWRDFLNKVMNRIVPCKERICFERVRDSQRKTLFHKFCVLLVTLV
jgi:hypothetical protein